MQSMVFKRFSILVFSFFVVTTVQTQQVFAAAISQKEFNTMLRQAIKDDPNIVLDLMRNNSEFVLDVAQQGANQRVARERVAQWQEDMKVEKKPVIPGFPVRGTEKAPVTIVVYTDFTCSYCQQSAATIEEVLKNFDGKVRLVTKFVPNEKVGLMAALYFYAAYEQDPKKAWVLYGQIFSDQTRLLEDGERFVEELAKNLKFDMKLLAKTMSDTKITNLIASARQEAVQFKLTGTPCFLVNNLRVRGAVPLDTFATAISMALEAAPKK